ncbi:ABC transporter ATP-binding protein [Leptospira ognonensis]|uniref:ABC transporter ATP-binding protein n=1 Tax=Leptospira ognonensis TaxID=2484945 RepID=A0A4R9K149_9LEPT|nr:ABC transporter ATP-binding protein [Leptospira ognonensis]TGL59393.1 ABC transporter ATP-binding protein [Leptospira ognonensis]
MGELELVALDAVSLDLNRGELVVLLGPSGSGKSTLLNILGGLDSPSKGKVRFEGKEISLGGEDDLTDYRRRYVGFVFQFYNLIPSLTSKENVLLVTELSEKSMSAEAALSLVDMGDRMDHFPSQLSGGEQQRVAIARAIAKNPDLLLCDEPTGALDFKTGKIVLDAIEKVNRELHTTTIIITHNEAIAQIADRIIKVRDGKIVSDKVNTHKLKTEEISW